MSPPGAPADLLTADLASPDYLWLSPVTPRPQKGPFSTLLFMVASLPLQLEAHPPLGASSTLLMAGSEALLTSTHYLNMNHKVTSRSLHMTTWHTNGQMPCSGTLEMLMRAWPVWLGWVSSYAPKGCRYHSWLGLICPVCLSIPDPRLGAYRRHPINVAFAGIMFLSLPFSQNQ